MSQPIARDSRRSVFAQSRHHGFARKPAACASTRAATIARTQHSPTETWPAMIAARHRSRRHDHRRSSHLARSVRTRQGADRHAATRDGRSSRQRRPLRHGDRRLAAGEGIETMLSLRCVLPTMPMVAALSANSPRRHPVPADATPALHRPRRRCGRRRGDDRSDGARQRGRDRGDRMVAAAGRLQ